MEGDSNSKQLSEVEKLGVIFHLGVLRTHWKAKMLSKLNLLRTMLDLQPRTEELKKGEYDSEVLNKLLEKDFSLLDSHQEDFNEFCGADGIKIALEGYADKMTVKPESFIISLVGHNIRKHLFSTWGLTESQEMVSSVSQGEHSFLLTPLDNEGFEVSLGGLIDTDVDQ